MSHSPNLDPPTLVWDASACSLRVIDQRRLPHELVLKELGTVEDVTRALMYFADPENGYVTGQTLYVCGGASIGGVTL